MRLLASILLVTIACSGEDARRADSPSAEPVVQAPELYVESPPPEPVHVYPCSLVVHLRDSETADPVHGTVQLWRMGFTPSEAWEANVPIVWTADSTDGSARFDRLVRGSYRLVCFEDTVEAPWGEPFEVAGELTEHVHRVRTVGPVDVFLELVDERGERIEEVAVRELTSRNRQGRAIVPPWIRELGPEEVERLEFLAGSGRFRSSISFFCGGTGPPYVPLVAEPPGFRLEFEADTRGWTRSRNLDVRVGDHRAVLLELRGPVVRDGQRFRGEFRPLRGITALPIDD